MGDGDGDGAVRRVALGFSPPNDGVASFGTVWPGTSGDPLPVNFDCSRTTNSTVTAGRMMIAKIVNSTRELGIRRPEAPREPGEEASALDHSPDPHLS